MDMDMDGIDDDALELILLRLGSPLSLTRAACTCKRWRRIAAGATFLRRFLLHGPLPSAGYYYNGTYDNGDWKPSFIPAPSSTIDERHFSVDDDDFPHSSRGHIVDTCGSLLLIRRPDLWKKNSACHGHGLIVCQPLTRRYRAIVPPSEFGSCVLDDAYLLQEPDHGEDDDMASFRVLCVFDGTHHSSNHRAGVFTVGSDNGFHFPAIVVNDAAGDNNIAARLYMHKLLGRVGGRLYWAETDGRVRVLDGSTMELSSFMFPDMAMWNATMPDRMRCTFFRRVFRVIAGGGGSLLIVYIAGDVLHIFARAPSTGRWPWRRASGCRRR